MCLPVLYFVYLGEFTECHYFFESRRLLVGRPLNDGHPYLVAALRWLDFQVQATIEALDAQYSSARSHGAGGQAAVVLRRERKGWISERRRLRGRTGVISIVGSRL